MGTSEWHAQYPRHQKATIQWFPGPGRYKETEILVSRIRDKRMLNDAIFASTPRTASPLDQPEHVTRWNVADKTLRPGQAL